MAFQLPELPFDKTALEPHMSSQTFDFHHGKHHAAYVNNLNKMLEGHALAEHSLEDVILQSAKDSSMGGIFNNAAQIWNHSFFWNCLSPKGGGAPKGDLADKINQDFGSYENFVEEFKKAAATQFGSGWAWLTLTADEALKISKSPNAATPLTDGETPLLTLDVWEHAYYLDYQNRRPDFITTFLEKLVNWDFANQNYANALQQAA
ncbi:MAG: superoxide dismutase [Pseudomonadota bacterium]